MRGDTISDEELKNYKYMGRFADMHMYRINNQIRLLKEDRQNGCKVIYL